MSFHSAIEPDDALPATRLPALIEAYPAEPDGDAPSYTGRHSVFSPQAQGAFLAHLQLFGNVRLACQAARVSTQTAYRHRRASPAPGTRRCWPRAPMPRRSWPTAR